MRQKWAGGETDFKKGPYAMTVRSLYVKDYTSAKEYTWDGMDASGAWEKVTVVAYVCRAIEAPLFANTLPAGNPKP